MLQTLKSIGSQPLKATAQYIWLFHLFYLFWEVPILQKFFFKISDLHVVRYHTISATLGFNDTQPLQCDDLSFPSISHHCISLSWNRDLMKILYRPKITLTITLLGILQQVSLTHFTITLSIWNEEIDFTAQYSEVFLWMLWHSDCKLLLQVTQEDLLSQARLIHRGSLSTGLLWGSWYTGQDFL